MGKPKSVMTAQPPLRKRFQRLPKLVKPIHYDITIEPSFTEPIFSGHEEIKVQIVYETTDIVLNAVKISVDNIYYIDDETKEKLEGTVAVHRDTERITLSFPRSLQLGTGILKFSFKGIINSGTMKGAFISKQNDREERVNYVTFFAPTYARNLFPCFDEPSIKSLFSMTLICPKDRTGLSNMPVREEKEHEVDPNLRILKFEPSPIMSTYLVAFVIGDYDYLEAVSEDGVLCRVYTPPGKKDQGQFALDLTCKILKFYKEYFGIAYPLPKLDLVASHEYPCSAMENFGLIIFRESRLLVDKDLSSASCKESVALIVAHEISHQWFGNLVTMEWWSDIWLNEGFAMFMEYLCVSHFFPEWNIFTQFATSVYTPALRLDALKSSHPIEVKVEDPSEIDEVFDDISYYKGASVIRMLYHYLGPIPFQLGIKDYIKRFEYQNAETADLWSALEMSSRKPVREVMENWTKQKGFPLVTLQSSVYDEANSSRILTLSTKKFWSDLKLNEKGSFTHFQWRIPITVVKGSSPSEVAVEELIDEFETRILQVVVPNVASKNEWVKLNAGICGFYRVSYDSATLEAFLPAIRNQTMRPLDRLGILDDLFASVLASLSPTVDILRILEAFKLEENYSVWCDVCDVLDKLSSLMDYTDFFGSFKKFGLSLLSNIYEKIGWDPIPGEDHQSTMLRPCILNQLVAFGHPEVIQEAKKRFELYVNEKQEIPADLRQVVYEAALSDNNGNQDFFDTAIELYNKADLLEEKLRILRSFSLIRKPEVLEKVLNFSLSDKVKAQDSVTIIYSISHTKEGRECAWSFFQKNWEIFQARFQGGFIISRLVKSFENFISEEKATEIENFFRVHKFRGTNRVVNQVSESIHINSCWLEHNKTSLATYFR